MEISKSLISADRCIDYTPVFSTLTNAIILLAKAVFFLMSFFGIGTEFRKSPLVEYINNKPAKYVCLLAIPMLNIFVASIYYEKKPIETISIEMEQISS